MDLKQYFGDLRAKEAELEQKYPDGVVHVTSVFYRERNSTPGSTSSANYHNAARVITDGTHREATEAEIHAFYSHQREELERNLRAEQQKRQQFVVIGEHGQDPNAVVIPSVMPKRGATLTKLSDKEKES